jgi:hypothetical protein
MKQAVGMALLLAALGIAMAQFYYLVGCTFILKRGTSLDSGFLGRFEGPERDWPEDSEIFPQHIIIFPQYDDGDLVELWGVGGGLLDATEVFNSEDVEVWSFTGRPDQEEEPGQTMARLDITVTPIGYVVSGRLVLLDSNSLELEVSVNGVTYPPIRLTRS